MLQVYSRLSNNNAFSSLSNNNSLSIGQCFDFICSNKVINFSYVSLIIYFLPTILRSKQLPLTNRTNCNSNIFTKNTPIRRRTFMLAVKAVYKPRSQEEKGKAVKQIMIRILKNRQQNELGCYVMG